MRFGEGMLPGTVELWWNRQRELLADRTAERAWKNLDPESAPDIRLPRWSFLQVGVHPW
jgi:hypothetical protein